MKNPTLHRVLHLSDLTSEQQTLFHDILKDVNEVDTGQKLRQLIASVRPDATQAVKIDIHGVTLAPNIFEFKRVPFFCEDADGLIPDNLAMLTTLVLKIHDQNGDLDYIADLLKDKSFRDALLYDETQDETGQISIIADDKDTWTNPGNGPDLEELLAEAKNNKTFIISFMPEDGSDRTDCLIGPFDDDEQAADYAKHHGIAWPEFRNSDTPAVNEKGHWVSHSGMDLVETAGDDDPHGIMDEELLHPETLDEKFVLECKVLGQQENESHLRVYFGPFDTREDAIEYGEQDMRITHYEAKPMNGVQCNEEGEWRLLMEPFDPNWRDKPHNRESCQNPCDKDDIDDIFIDDDGKLEIVEQSDHIVNEEHDIPPRLEEVTESVMEMHKQNGDLDWVRRLIKELELQ